MGVAVPTNSWYRGSAGLFGNTSMLPSSNTTSTVYDSTVPSGCWGKLPRHVGPSGARSNELGTSSSARHVTLIATTARGVHIVVTGVSTETSTSRFVTTGGLTRVVTNPGTSPCAPNARSIAQ